MPSLFAQPLCLLCMNSLFKCIYIQMKFVLEHAHHCVYVWTNSILTLMKKCAHKLDLCIRSLYSIWKATIFTIILVAGNAF